MDRLFALRSIAPLAMTVVPAYAAIYLWRRRFARRSPSTRDGFRPKVGFTHLDGMASLALLLSNNSDKFVWVEELEIFLSDLKAHEQVAEPSCNETLKIRQMAPPHDMVPISLVASIYKAAGEPQRRYSCVLFSIVRYRIGEEWFERELEAHRIQMIGLVASTVRRERGFVPPSREKAPEVPETAAVK